MTLYLKYRSQTLDELDQESVRESLKKIVEGSAIPHAFLFSGPKGTGKTSSARILAKIINCTDKNKPCNKCEQCVSITKGNNLDVIELDAASHRGIDDVRALRDAVKLAPTKATKKIYIIDEAHMLTVEASNALLKTLEEPPDHVVFILATTNPEKLIDTIRSRTTQVNFKKATNEEVVRSLTRIAEGEKIKAEKEVLELIAQASGGSFRDGVKTLEQLILEGVKLEKEIIAEILFKNKSLVGDDLFKIVLAKDTKKTLEHIENLVQKGVTGEEIINKLLALLRLELLAAEGIGEVQYKIEKNEALQLIELLTSAKKDINVNPIEQLPLEIAIIKWGEEDGGQSQRVRADQNSLPETSPQTDSSRSTSPDSQQKVETSELDSASQSLAQTKNPEIREQPVSPATIEISDEVWKQVLLLVKPINASVEALLRSSKPLNFDGNTLTLGVFYKFHKERLEDSKHKKVLEDVVGKAVGKDYIKVICVLTDPPPKKIIQENPGEAVLTEAGEQDIIDIAEKIFNN